MAEYLAVFRVLNEPTVIGFLSDGAMTFLRTEGERLRRGELVALCSGGFRIVYENEEPVPPDGDPLTAFRDFPTVSWDVLETIAAVLTSPAAVAMGAPRPKPKGDPSHE